MNLSKIVSELNLDVVAGIQYDNVEVNGVYIGDLLSLVMAKASEKNIWITIQTHLNVVAVATLVGISTIIIAEDSEIESDTIKKAKEVGMPILKTHLSAYEIACKLHDLGL